MALPHRQSTVPDSHDYFDAEFDDLMEGLMREFHIPGASIAVVRNDQISSKGYGVLYADGPNVTSETLFNAASMSKSFTAGAVGLLVDDEDKYPHVTWNTPVSTLMREDFVLADSYATEHTTAVDILSHRTGVYGHDIASFSPRSKTPDTPQSITRGLRHFPLSKPFRTEWQYNNAMYGAASYLVEKLTNTPFYTFLQTHFWSPLSMHRTFGGVQNLPGGHVPSDELSWSSEHNIALGHHYQKKSSQYKRLSFFNEPEGQGSGNIISTAPDFAKWIQSMMLHTNALSSTTIAELTKPRILSGDNSNNSNSKKEPFHSPQFYCMGWDTEWYRGHKCLEHSGGIPGFTSLMRYMPEQKFGFVMFGNSGGMYEVSQIVGWKLIDDFLGIKESERMDWKRRITAPDGEDEEKEPFSNCVDPPIPLPLPLEKFTGTFGHPAFGEFEFKIAEDGKQLIADARDRTFGFWLRLEHVSGLFFVANVDDVDEDEEEDFKCEAEFTVGVDGNVDELGVDFENEEGSEMFWLKRVQA